MKKTCIAIDGIPAVLWGDPAERLFIAVHGNLSNKEDTVIDLFAREAVEKGCQVLSFDLPEHGGRRGSAYACTVQHGMADLTTVLRFARQKTQRLSLFGCSMGAYFSLLAFREVPFEQAFFLSPIVNMERLIRGMMVANNVSEERLKIEKEIPIANGPPLSWDYFEYVCSHPVDRWPIPTSILYGSNDDLTDRVTLQCFVDQFHCQLEVLQGGEHYFHTPEQLSAFRGWVRGGLFTVS